MEASKLVHRIWKFINYANLCKFTEPRKGPGGAISYFFLLGDMPYNGISPIEFVRILFLLLFLLLLLLLLFLLSV